MFVTDQNRILRGLVHVDDAIKCRKQKSLEDCIREDEIYTTWPETPLSELLGQAMVSRYPLAVVDHDGRLLGVLDRASILAEVEMELPGAVAGRAPAVPERQRRETSDAQPEEQE